MARVSVRPLDALLDRPVAIEVSELRPGSRLQLHLRCHTLKAESRAEFAASDSGVVDVATHAPVAGDYEGIDPAGLFWSARFDPGSDVVTMTDVLSSLEPIQYTLTATVDGSPDVNVNFTRQLLASNLVRTPVREGRIRGTLFARAGAVNVPGVVVLGGSDGHRSRTFVAALLAAHGFAVLSLAYFDQHDLPKELIEIPVEYFAEGVDWLRARPEVGTARVGVLGMSRGGEAALLLGASCPHVAAVVALVASGITGGGNGADFSAMARSAWTLNGVPCPILPPAWDPESVKEVQDAIAAGKPVAGGPSVIRTLQSAAARLDEVAIPVERTRGPIFMMSGEDDQLWASAALTDIAERRLRTAAFAYPSEHHRYPAAGHFAVLPPNLPTTSNSGRHPMVPMVFAFGGSAKGNAAASADLWPRMVTFLERHLASAAVV